jgi:hypothetical protein
VHSADNCSQTVESEQRGQDYGDGAGPAGGIRQSSRTGDTGGRNLRRDDPHQLRGDAVVII